MRMSGFGGFGRFGGFMIGVMGLLFSFACFGGNGNPNGRGGIMEDFPSQHLNRKVPISLHIPSQDVMTRWKAANPNVQGRLVLFLPGAYDGPKDPIRYGIYAYLAEEETSGHMAPALWVSVTNYKAWYADRKDGSFNYEKFLVEELIPQMEKRFPDFGGSAKFRSVAGLSMGGFGALNLCGRTSLFSRCAALSPALVEPPFDKAGWFVRRSLKRAFPQEAEAFAPWNPWKHLGGTAQLYLGCGLEDKYGLAPATKDFADLCLKRGRSVSLDLQHGNHDWDYWTPEFKRLAPWIQGGPLPTDGTALKTQQSPKPK